MRVMSHAGRPIEPSGLKAPTSTSEIEPCNHQHLLARLALGFSNFLETNQRHMKTPREGGRVTKVQQVTNPNIAMRKHCGRQQLRIQVYLLWFGSIQC